MEIPLQETSSSNVMPIVVMKPTSMETDHAVSQQESQPINASQETTTISDTNNSSSAIVSKPIIYLHVGPLKTASTTIQWIAQQQSVRAAAFEKDNLILLADEKRFPQKLNRCIRNYKRASELCDKDLKDVFKKYEGENKTLFLSHERISAFINDAQTWKYWQEALTEWDVHVIVVYRRTYEWELSWFNQIYKLYNLSPGIGYRQRSAKVEGNLRLYFENFDSSSNMRPSNIYKAFLRSGHQVQVVNMHAQGDVVEGIFCENIKTANTTCAAVMDLNKRSKISKKNMSTFQGYDRIAVAAYRMGLVTNSDDESCQRGYVRKHIQKRHEHELGLKSSNFPVECVSREILDRLLNLTIQEEKIIFPIFSKSVLGEETLRQNFDTATGKGSFCNVDTVKILANQSWVDFFTNVTEECPTD